MALANVNAEKTYLNSPKALGITVRRLQFNPKKLNDIILLILH
jgi:hypothetical protein